MWNVGRLGRRCVSASTNQSVSGSVVCLARATQNLSPEVENVTLCGNRYPMGELMGAATIGLFPHFATSTDGCLRVIAGPGVVADVDRAQPVGVASKLTGDDSLVAENRGNGPRRDCRLGRRGGRLRWGWAAAHFRCCPNHSMIAHGRSEAGAYLTRGKRPCIHG